MRYKKSEVSIAHIVNAAMQVLARQGYANTSLMDIAKEAGMSKGAVHYHFPTKEELMTEVCQAVCDEVAKSTRTAWTSGDNPTESIRSSLRELWRVRAELSVEVLVIADLLTQSLHDESLRKPLAEYYRFATSQINEHMMENLIKIGFRPKIPQAMVPPLLHALLDGFLMQHIVDPEAFTEEDIVNTLEMLAASLFEVHAVPPEDSEVGG